MTRVSRLFVIVLMCAGCDSDPAASDAGRDAAAAPDAASADAGGTDAGRVDAGSADAAADGGADDVRVAETRTEGCWSLDRVAFPGARAIDLALTADGTPRVAVIADFAAWLVEPAGEGRWRAARIGGVDPAFSSWITLGIDGDGRSHVLYSFGVAEGGEQLGTVYATDASGEPVLRKIGGVSTTDGEHRLEHATAYTEDGRVRFLGSTWSDNGTRFDAFADIIEVGDTVTGTPVLTVENTPDRFLEEPLVVTPRPGDGAWAAIGARGQAVIAPLRDGATPETVRGGGAGRPSLAFDASGDPWVAFSDNHGTFFSDRLVVAHRDGDGWVEEIAEDEGLTIGQTGTAVDGSGAVHVVFGNVRHAVRDGGGTWSVTTIGSGEAPALRESGGVLHLAYFESEAIHVGRCAP